MSLVFKGFPCSSDGKESEMQETQVWSLGWEDPWRKEWQPTLVFVPENSMDRGAWQAIVHGVAKSWHNWVTNPLVFELNSIEKSSEWLKTKAFFSIYFA